MQCGVVVHAPHHFAQRGAGLHGGRQAGVIHAAHQHLGAVLRLPLLLLRGIRQRRQAPVGKKAPRLVPPVGGVGDGGYAFDAQGAVGDVGAGGVVCHAALQGRGASLSPQ